MKIALHDSDNTRFPNLVLMKLSAWHKAQGDDVRWYDALFGPFNKVYSSKIFTFTPVNDYLPKDAILGGTGYRNNVTLQDDIEHICPDYSLYGIDYSVGFLTRGCIRKCQWCVVPSKEGDIRAHADIEEFCRHDKAILLDNNVLSSPHGISQIEKIARLGIKVDFNQGIDARLIDDDIARLFGRVKWLSPVRLACDTLAQIKDIERAVELLRWHNCTPSRYFCYVLVRDMEDAIKRVRLLKKLYLSPFAQPYIDPDGTPATEEQRHFARWVNHKAEFGSRTWEGYKKAHMGF